MGFKNYKQFVIIICVIVCYCVLAVKSYPKVFANSNSKIRKYRNTLLDQLEPIELDTRKYYSNIIVDKHIREKCGVQNFKNNMRYNSQLSKCKSRDTVVHLYSAHSNIEMIPNRVVVKRCYESGCYGKKSCMPTKVVDLQVAVRFANRVSQEQHCGWVNVTEHSECRCKCHVTKEECQKENKIFDASECRCQCPDEESKRANCQRNKRMVWNEKTCSCQCNTDFTECSTGREWVPRMCQCMKVLMPELGEDDKRYIYETIHKSSN